MAQLDPKRAVAMMKTLRGLTSDANGNQRVVFTPVWTKAVDFFKAEMAKLKIPVRMDVAGNLWAELAGKRPESIVIGGHLDSVPNGGWLDGCWNVIAGIEVLRAIKERGVPPSR